MSSQKTPAVFVTDFGPFLAVETDDYTNALEKLGAVLSQPRAIIIMSGHWEARKEITVTSAIKPGIVHDYSGFPQEFYRLDYPCPGDPVLAKEVVALLSSNGIAANPDSKRPLDHGAWVPLSRIFPKADIPTIQIAARSESPEENFRIGQTLSKLRERGILLIGAGALSYNLRLALAHGKDDPVDNWALQFDNWLQENFDDGNTEALLDYRKNAPFANLAAPTVDHFNPIFFVLGASERAKPTHLYRSMRYSNGIMRIMVFN